MVGRQEQNRMCHLLVESITMLCRNGLSFKSEVTIDGLLALTVDQNQVVVVPIRETIKAPSACLDETDSSSAIYSSKKRKKRKHSNDDAGNLEHEEALLKTSSAQSDSESQGVYAVGEGMDEHPVTNEKDLIVIKEEVFSDGEIKEEHHVIGSASLKVHHLSGPSPSGYEERLPGNMITPPSNRQQSKFHGVSPKPNKKIMGTEYLEPPLGGSGSSHSFITVPPELHPKGENAGSSQPSLLSVNSFPWITSGYQLGAAFQSPDLQSSPNSCYSSKRKNTLNEVLLNCPVCFEVAGKYRKWFPPNYAEMQEQFKGSTLRMRLMRMRIKQMENNMCGNCAENLRAINSATAMMSCTNSVSGETLGDGIAPESVVGNVSMDTSNMSL